jgi:DNA-nicking Smr family endonuclease
MSRSRKSSDGDLFAAVFRDVKPLRRSKIAPHALAAPAARAEPRAVSPRRADTPHRPAAIAPAAPPPAPNPGIDRRTAERLRKGVLEIDRTLDLHGMTEAAAHTALDRFVRQAWRDQARVLLVITGKGSVGAGGGVLRRNLPRWLAAGENAAHVLRIESAQPRHGGAGAFYVLLRRRREAGA